MRGLLSCAAALWPAVRRAPPLVFQHNDLLPSAGVARAVRAAAARAERVVALSHAIAADLDRGARDVEVIHPGVDLDRFRPRRCPTGPPQALVLGAIVRLEAARTSRWRPPRSRRRELPGLRIRLAGAPLDDAGHELLAQLRARAAQPDLAGRVRARGDAADASDALAARHLPAALRRPRAVRDGDGRGAGQRQARGRARAPGAAGDRGPRAAARSTSPGTPTPPRAALVEVIDRAPELSAPARARAERLFDVRDSQPPLPRARSPR